MLHALLLSASALAAPIADTTVQIPRGSHVVIEHGSGDIDVIGIGGREARITVDGESRGVEVSRSGNAYYVSAGYMWDDDDAELVVRLPRDVSLAVHVLEGGIRAFDIAGEVELTTIEGDVEAEGTGSVTVSTADGSVRLADIDGDATVATGDGDTRIDGVAGNVTVEGIDGDIVIRDADAVSVDLQTIDGDIRYDGAVYAGGRYSLAAHDGSVTFALPEGAGATFSVSAFDGSFNTSFAVQFRGGPLRGAEFSVGDGAARVTLETFDGDINLIRPGERAPDHSR